MEKKVMLKSGKIEIPDDMLETITGGVSPDTKMEYTVTCKCGKSYTASSEKLAKEKLEAHMAVCKG